MATTIKIGGVDYSTDDPCTIADALRGVKAQRSAGEQILETERRSPVSQERLQFQPASSSDITSEIAYWDNLCKIKTTGRRSNYAAGFRYGRC